MPRDNSRWDGRTQWGVELGKILAKRITLGLVSESEPLLGQDISTNTLLQRYRGPRAKTYFLSGHDHFQENFPLVRRDPGNIKDS